MIVLSSKIVLHNRLNINKKTEKKVIKLKGKSCFIKVIIFLNK